MPSEKESLPKKRISVKLLKRFVWLILVIILASFIYLSQQPSKGRITYVIPTPDPRPQPALVQEYIGKHISFLYPGTYELKDNSASDSGYLERIIFIGSGLVGKKIAISVQKTTAGALGDVSAVQFRRLKKNSYREEPLTLTGRTGLLFIRTDTGYEKTAVFLNNQILSTISLSSNSNDPDLEQNFATLTGSWKWL